MLAVVDADNTAALFDQVAPQIIDPDVRVHPVLAVGRLLSLVEQSHLRGMVGDVQIAVLVSVVDAPVAAEYPELRRENATESLCCVVVVLSPMPRGADRFRFRPKRISAVPTARV